MRSAAGRGSCGCAMSSLATVGQLLKKRTPAARPQQRSVRGVLFMIAQLSRARLSDGANNSCMLLLRRSVNLVDPSSPISGALDEAAEGGGWQAVRRSQRHRAFSTVARPRAVIRLNNPPVGGSIPLPPR